MFLRQKYYAVFLFFFQIVSPLFAQVTFISSNLPLVVLNTNGQTIPDDPKIQADMGIIWNGPGNRNSLKDRANEYNGTVGIEVRGSSSQQMFPKKSYGIETRLADGSNLNVSLLGMPEENDWILYAPYTDKTMIRDVLSYTLDASMGHYSPRCRYVELFLNGNYQGVYVLMEKIKRNKYRVDIAKLTTSDTEGVDLTGGYIIKIDKTTGSGGEGWYSDYVNDSNHTYYQYDYPESDEITSEQMDYIQAYVKGMEEALYSRNFSGAGSYHDFLNDSSFIDFMIINELAKNIDGYRLSSYLFKDKNERLNCGPIWDFNLTYGNGNYLDGWLTTGLEYQANMYGGDWQNPFWWNRLMQDPNFENKLKKRWALLREKELSTERISFVTDSLVNVISEAQVRNYQRWKIIGKYVWPNYYIGPSYESEVLWMNDWITNRLAYLDQMWPYNFNSSPDLAAIHARAVYPNPFTDRFSVQLLSTLNEVGFAELYSASGSLLQKRRVELRNGQTELNFSAENMLAPGLYLLKITAGNRVLLTEKMVKGR